ncbi:MAG TPA: amidase [Jatrophihabitantaceae bacterium]|nr:amidase [Jatrophihabitantaceae bacterium]
MTQLHDMTALEQAAAVKARQVSPSELVEHYLDRIDRLDGQLGAFVTVTADAARAEAAAATRRVLDGAELPALYGVPLAVKDLNATKGVPTKLGSRVFADWVPDYDDNVVVRMRQAGTISLGKTSVPEIGLPCYTEPVIGPPARTPWDTTRLAGGSSGGAAAAVAGGLLPIAQGSDGGGSIRIPASLCGLVGLKPSRGRVSRGPIDGDAVGLSVLGPLAHTVRDAAAFLDAVAGPMPGDPTWAPPLPAGETFLAACDRPPGRLRIARTLGSPIATDIDPEVVQAWEEATVLLAGLGHEIIDVDALLPDDAVPLFESVWAAGAAGAPIPPDLEPELVPLTRYLRQRGRALTAGQYAQAIGGLYTMCRRAIVAMADFDAILTPTLAQLARPVGWFTAGGDPAEDFERQKRFTPWTALYNSSGQPAISLPLFQSASGLPIGIMLAGRPAGETALLSLAAQVEEAVPWHARHPAIWTQ